MIPSINLRSRAQAIRVEVPSHPHLLRMAISTWRGRMINEYSSAPVFEGLAIQLENAGFSLNEIEQCKQFAREERKHGVLCGAVLEALGAEAIIPARPAHTFPHHENVSGVEGVIRNLLSISCMSETIAVALVGAERIEMPEGALRDLLTEIYADEVGHARFGWRIVQREVPALDEATKARLSRYLSVAFAHVEQHELEHLSATSAPPAEGVELGVCNGADARALFYDTINEVIIPQLDALGLRASDAWMNRPRANALAS